MGTANNFNMTAEECKLVFDHFDRLVIVDNEHKIRYISSDLLELLEVLSHKTFGAVAGKPIEEIHPLSKITHVLESKEAIEECFYFSGGEINVARIKPVILGNQVWGAMDYDIFRTEKDFRRFFDEVAEMTTNGFISFSKELKGLFLGYEELSKGFKYHVGSIIGESLPIQQLRQEIYDLAESDSTVLISGETGSGKELIAQSIHTISRRARNRIVKINCAAIPENLLESELFGYEDGAFTGAQKGGKIGKLEYANGGTVFLDEVDHLAYHLQPKLLRFLQEREVDRIGGSESIPVDVRLIVATNKNLKELVTEGKFREDLYYRLNVIEMKVPPLRTHKEDIPMLVDDCIQRINKFLGKNIQGIDSAALRLLCNYDWPGNVRELMNMVERAMNKCRQDLLMVEHFDTLLFQMDHPSTDGISNLDNPLEYIKDIAEAEAIRRVLDATSWNITQSAKLLKISRPALYYKIEKHKIEKEGVR